MIGTTNEGRSVRGYTMHSATSAAPRRYKLIMGCLVLFALSLPFNGIEWNIISIPRFELKPTMITFGVLLFALALNSSRVKMFAAHKEKFFYSCVFFYGLAQFASLFNSTFPLESLKQGIIIVSLLLVMVVTSRIASDKRAVEYALAATGVLSILISILAIIDYYFISSAVGRLGARGGKIVGTISMGGDAIYFGDILLYSVGAVFFVLFKLREKKLLKLLIAPILIFWFSAIAVSITKGLILAVFFFLLSATALIKGKRIFMSACVIVFLSVMILNFKIIPNFKSNYFLTQIGSLSLIERLDVTSGTGFNAIAIRKKAIILSWKSSLSHFWFGWGAGTSQKILPEIANEHDRNIDPGSHEYHAMHRDNTYGEEANKSLTDSHVFFLTEFFNVGIFGLISLVGIVVFVIVEQFKVVMRDRDGDIINVLLFLTLISMLIYRLTQSLIVIPFLWFVMGLSLGAAKFYRQREMIN